MSFQDYHYMGDYDIAYGGTFIDPSTWSEGYVDALHVTEVHDVLRGEGTVSIARGTIHVPEQGETYKHIATFNGDVELANFDPAATSDVDMRVFMAEQLRAYHGMEPDTEKIVVIDVRFDPVAIQVDIEQHGINARFIQDALSEARALLSHAEVDAILCADPETAHFLTGIALALGIQKWIGCIDLEDYIREEYDLSVYRAKEIA